MNTVGPQEERSLHVVVDDEWDAVARAEASRRTSSLDDVEPGNVLQAPLNHGRATLDGKPRRLELVDDRVQLHAAAMLARSSSVAGSSAASAS